MTLVTQKPPVPQGALGAMVALVTHRPPVPPGALEVPQSSCAIHDTFTVKHITIQSKVSRMVQGPQGRRCSWWPRDPRGSDSRKSSGAPRGTGATTVLGALRMGGLVALVTQRPPVPRGALGPPGSKGTPSAPGGPGGPGDS